MLQRLPIALAQGKAGNTSENLLNEIRKIVNSLYQEKEITKNLCNNKMSSMNSSLYLWILRIAKYLILTEYY